MSQDKSGPHHDHPGHKPGDNDEHGHRDQAGKKKDVPDQHLDHPGHKTGDKDGHRDQGGVKKN